MVLPRIAPLMIEAKSDLIGGVGDTTIPNYSGAMFVAGGSGVTFALSAVQDLVLAGAKSRIQVIEVIWSVADPSLYFVYPCACIQLTELFCQLSWSTSSPCSLRSRPKAVLPDSTSQYFILVLLPVHLKDSYSHLASPSRLGVRRLRNC